MRKIDISAIVVGLNESALLQKCLQSISFCREIHYFDLGSVDNSVEIAALNASTIHSHERVPAVEYIHAEYAKKTRYKWVLILDPDEVLDISLVRKLQDLFEQGIEGDVAAIKVPCRFYYKNKSLKGTPWGGANTRILLAHTDRFIFTENVHQGRMPLPGFKVIQIGETNECSHHYWMRDFKGLYEKHKRYLQKEGLSRYKNGARTSIVKVLFIPLKQFYFSFFTKKGYKDGITGLLLSTFWSWYQTAASIKLYKIQKVRKDKA